MPFSAQTNSLSDIVARANDAKPLFTAGPASLLEENLSGLRPCFGRSDPDYAQDEQFVLNQLRAMSGHAHLIRLQGAASLALEIAVRNFLQGRVLVVQSGAYSDRLRQLAESAQTFPGEVHAVHTVTFGELENVAGSYDWILACYTETSVGMRLPIKSLRQLAERCSAKLMLDATASIGLESSHELADVIAYSSCKGLFGLTGAAFIASHHLPGHSVNSFYLDYATHAQKGMTGPYHAILSLAPVLRRHDEIRESVFVNKARFLRRFAAHLVQSPELEPMLCTQVSCKVRSTHPGALLYASRHPIPGSIVCHLGEAHLGTHADGKLVDYLEVQS